MIRTLTALSLALVAARSRCFVSDVITFSLNRALRHRFASSKAVSRSIRSRAEHSGLGAPLGNPTFE